MHTLAREQTRGSAAARGYDRQWRALARRFRGMLIAAGIAPVCGARLPGAPVTQDSQCQAEGRLVDDAAHRRWHGTGLHTDHIVSHRGNEQLRMDVHNLQLLCKPEHDEKTLREGGAGYIRAKISRTMAAVDRLIGTRTQSHFQYSAGDRAVPSTPGGE
jgi:hypothetical protein